MSQEPPTPGRIKPIPDTREPDRGTGGRAEAGSPSDGPLADGTLADKPVADEPFADGPVTDGPLADGMLAESESPLPTEAEGTTEGHGEDDIDLSGGKTLSDYVRDEDLPGGPEKEAPVFKAIPNAVGLVMPPPPGVQRPTKGARRGSRAPAVGTAPAGEDGNFGEMLAHSVAARTFEEGQTVTGTLVAIRPDVAFLDIGGKSEVPIDIGELKDEEGDIEFEVGDTIEALVVAADDGTKLSRKLARGAAAAAQLGDAFRAGLPVEGRVEKPIKGGYEVRVAGQRGFCPLSQIDRVRTADPSIHAGQLYTFRIIEYKNGGKNLVLSRRILLQEEERAQAEENRKKIVVGAVLTGRVVSVREYGAFVDLGGTQGLLHVSEMGWSRVTNPAEMLKPGDEISVKVLKIDEQKGRIALGLKQLQPDPWNAVAERYRVGQITPGKIVRLQDFGAFVEIEPGIEGLAHVSTFPPTGTPDGWKRTVPPGTAGQFEVLMIDTERKRIGVAMLEEGHTRADLSAGRGDAARAAGDAGREGSNGRGGDAAWAQGRAEDSGSAPGIGSPGRSGMTEGAPPRAQGARAGSGGHPGAPQAQRAAIDPGMRIKGKVERHEKYGVFVYLAPGRTGLLAATETGEPRGADLRKSYPIGSEVEVLVLEVEPSGRRIRLSRKTLLDAEEKSDARAYVERRQTVEAFGSIGDKLRAALESRKK